MTGLSILRDVIIVFAVGVSVVALLRRIGVPSIAGFIVAGTLLGPRSLGLIQNTHEVEILADIGVVLLLFGIGVELSQERLRRLWKPVVVGGALQVGTTLLATVGVAMLLGSSWQLAVLLGCLVAVSSTAIVLRGLQRRGELDAPHGRLTLGILVFQDLCVVPMVLAIPLISGGPGTGSAPLAALLKAAGLLTGVLVTSRLIVPRALHVVARTRQRDLFLLSVLLVCLGTAWIVSRAGVSLALGAFLAGLVVAGSEYRHQALADLIPFREVFASLFFVSMGMLLDPAALLRSGGPILALLAAILVGKFSIVFLVGLAMHLSLRVCVLAGMALAQVGEFSFVLSRAAQDSGLFQGALVTDFSIAVTLSMLVTPILLTLGPHVAAGLGKSRALTRLLEVRTCVDVPETYGTLREHVVIAGYGIAGRDLAQSLKESGIPYVIVDINSENVRSAARSGEPAFFGDVTNPEVLEKLGVGQAHELVLVINDPDAAERAVRAARRAAPDLSILVRSRYLGDVERLRKAGATEVVAAEIQASGEITSRVLSRHGVPTSVVDQHLERIRRRGGRGELRRV